MTERSPRTKLYRSRVRFCSIKEVFDFRTFDYVRLAKRLGEFDYVRLPNPIQINRTIEVRLSSITERSIGYVGHLLGYLRFLTGSGQRLSCKGLWRWLPERM